MSRRRALALGVALAVAGVVPSVAAAENPPPTASRTVVSDYVRAGGVAVPGSLTYQVTPGPWQRAAPTEDRVKVRAQDASGRTVALDVDYTPRGASASTSVLFCGSTPTLSIAPGSQVRGTPVAGLCPGGGVSLPSSGTVAVVFTRPLPRSRTGILPEQRWALLVGIQTYAGSTHPTVGGRGDVLAVQKSLLAAGWRSDHIRVLLDGEASGQAILDAMSWLAAQSSAGTFSLFHFSGHVCISRRGPCAAGHTYLWGADNTFVPESTVGQVLGGVRGRAWFDIAGCESGAFDVGLHSSKRLFSGSSQASETSYEEPSWNESVWSGLVWDQGYLQRQAASGPGRPTIAQMVGFGRTQAPKVTADQQSGPQHPYVAGDLSQSLWAPVP